MLKPNSNWSLFKLIISDQTLVKWKYFLPLYVKIIGQTLSSVFEQFSFTSKVFGFNMQKPTFFKEKMVLRVVFIKLKFRWLQTGLSDWKNTKQLKFCLWWIFNAFFKMLHFSKLFKIFEIHQNFLVKLLNALNFI